MVKRGFGLFGLLVVGALLVVCVGCSDDSGGEADAGGMCLASLNTDCQPPWNPSFGQLFSRVVQRSCSSSATGSQCHAEAGGAAGLFLFDEAAAYDALVNGHGGGAPLVVPYDPACSELIKRLESTVAGYGMPIGGQLPESERCAFVKWVEAGAMPGE